MSKKQLLQTRLISIFSIGLIVYFLSACTSLVPTIPENQRPPMPVEPELAEVTFEPHSDGLFLSFEEYRQLERNIIEMRLYIEGLKAQIVFYTGQKHE